MAITVRAAVEQYQDELKSLGRAANTITNRIGYLRRFADVCDRASSLEECTVALIDAQKVTGFFNTLPSDGSKANAISSLRGFAKWAVRCGYMKEKAAQRALEGRSYSAPQRQPKHYIPVEEFDRFLTVSGERHPVERAAAAVALYTLCRQGEVATIHLKEVNLRKGEIRVWRQKRKRWTPCAIPLELVSELETWLEWYASYAGYISYAVMMSEHPDWFLLPRRIYTAVRANGRDFTAWKISDLVPAEPFGRMEVVIKRALTALGVTTTATGLSVSHRGEGGHTLRRSGARALLDILSSDPLIGGDEALLQVSAMLDHEDIRVTQTYIGMDISRDRIHDRVRKVGMYQAKPTASGNVVPLRRAGG